MLIKSDDTPQALQNGKSVRGINTEIVREAAFPALIVGPLKPQRCYSIDIFLAHICEHNKCPSYKKVLKR